MISLVKNKLIINVILLVALIAIWQFFSNINFEIINFSLLPSPVKIVPNFFYLIFNSGEFRYDLWISFFRVTVGFTLSLIVGIILALISIQFEKIKYLITLCINIIKPVPNAIWLPIVIVLFPFQEVSIIFMPFIGSLPAIYFSTFCGMQNISKEIIDQTKIHKIKGGKFIFNILIPGSFFHIESGVRVGIGAAWMGIVLAEMVAGKDGVGYFTWQAFQSIDYLSMMTGAMAVVLLSFFSSWVILFLIKNIWRDNVCANFYD